MNPSKSQFLSTQLQFKNSNSPWTEPPKAVSVLMFPKLVKETSVSWDPRKPVGHAEAMDRRFAGMAPKKPVSCDSLETAKKQSRKSVEKYGKATKSINLLSEKWFQTCSNNGYPLDFRYFNDMSSESSVFFHSYLLPRTILYMHIRVCRSKVFAPWAQSSTTRSPKSLASLMMWSALCMLPNKWEMTTWASEPFTPRIPKGRDSNVKFLSAGPTHPGH